MKRRVGRPKKGKNHLTHAKIIGTAMRLVDENGIDAFSMRKLSAELDVDPMAVYYHVKNKRAILEELVKQAVDFSDLEIDVSRLADQDDWQREVKTFARYYVGLFRKHPNLILYLVANPESGTQAIQSGNEILFSVLLAGGLTPNNIVRAADVIVDYLNGYALAECTGRLPDNQKRLQEFKMWLEKPESAQFPMTKKVFQNIEGQIETDFEVGLDFILAGVAGLKNA